MRTKKSPAARAAKPLPKPPAEVAPLSDWDDLWGWPPQELEEPPRGEVIPFKPIQAEPHPDDALRATLAHARNQVEAMAGSWETSIRVRLIDQRHDVPKEQRRGARQLFGSLADDTFSRELYHLNTKERWDTYIVAQEVRDELPPDAAVKAREIVCGRVAVADFDGKRRIDQSLHHLGATFILTRENDKGHYWLGWAIESYDAASIPDLHHRIIQYYDSDPAVCDAARIVRLAGFWSHKRPERTRYLFGRGPGWDERATLADHLAKLPEVKRKPVPETDTIGVDYISEERARLVLRHNAPECKRPDWIARLGAIKDASIGRADRTYMEPFDKYQLADDFSSGRLAGQDSPANYLGFDDVADTIDTLDRNEGEDRAGFGTIVKAALEAGMNRAEHERLRKVELFKRPNDASPAEQTSERDAATEANDPGPEPADDYPEPLSATELATGHFPRAEFAWQDFIFAQHVNLLYGDGGAGKTLLAEHIAVAVAAGLPLFGRKTQQMPALLVLAEDAEGETKARLEAIYAKLGVDLSSLPLHIWCLPGHDVSIARFADDGTWASRPFMEPLRRKLAEIGPCFLVLDTVSDIALLDETKRPPVNTLCKTILQGLCDEFAVTILVTAHPSKAAMMDGSGYAGSTAWNNAVRNRLELKQLEKGRRRNLRVAKRNYGGEVELTLTLNPSDGTFATPAEMDVSGQEAEERQAVLDTVLELVDRGVQIVRSNGNGQKPRDVAREIEARHGLKLTPREVLDHMNALEREGKLAYRNATNQRRGVRTGFYRPNE